MEHTKNNWRTWYICVLAVLALQIVLYVLFTRLYQ
jgi:hypothetical protein